MKQALAYIRVSTEDQANSLIAQREKIDAYAKFTGLEVVRYFIDEGVSGGIPIGDRPQGRLMEYDLGGNIKDLGGVVVSNVIVVKPDRAFRNVIDALTTMDRWSEDGIVLHISDMGGASLNTDTAIGRLMFTTIITLAEFERGVTSERIKTVFESKKKNGKQYSREMYGFNNVDGNMVENELEQKGISSMKIMKAAGRSYSAIAAEFNCMGHKTKTGAEWHGSTIKYILDNPVHQNV